MKRKRVSIILLVTFLLLPVSAMLIDAGGKVGEIAGGIHGFIGLIFTFSGILHIIYNWKTLKAYIFKK